MEVTFQHEKIKDNTWRCKINDDLMFFIVSQGSNYDLPANGGLRFIEYQGEQDALEDAYVLSDLMEQKHAIYNTGFSGGKIVAKGKADQKNKQLLLKATSDLLNKLRGRVYTGCDLNTTSEDMKTLSAFTPYILAGIGTKVDPSYATAYGVYGSIEGTVGTNLEQHSFLVHGTGKVGSIVAQLLLDAGCRVYTHDILENKPNIPGSKAVSAEEWQSLPIDCLVLCSASRVISEEIAHKLKCKYIISGANNPFENAYVENIFTKNNVKWVPDPICNAGAVICDSIEFYNRDVFNKADPQTVYEFVREIIYQKALLFNWLCLSGAPKSRGIEILKEFSKYNQLRCGMLFKINESRNSFYEYHLPLHSLINQKASLQAACIQ